MIEVEYRANNSGGNWWLDDEDWMALEDAGWHVKWGGLMWCHSDFTIDENPEPTCKTNKECQGHRKCETAEEAEGMRFLGALAVEATKKFNTIQDALQEFEAVTGEDTSAEGCNCCGPPHSFSWKGEKGSDFCSGESCLPYLYPDKEIPGSIRECLEGSE